MLILIRRHSKFLGFLFRDSEEETVVSVLVKLFCFVYYLRKVNANNGIPRKITSSTGHEGSMIALLGS